MFATWRLNRAARAYAEKLPKKLFDDYGHEEFYTEPQIRNAIADAGLNPRYSALAYARYLTQDHYGRLRIHLDVPMDYDAARLLFIANEPIKLLSRKGSPGRNYFIRDRNSE